MESLSSPRALLRKSKRYVASYVSGSCSNSESRKSLEGIMDILTSPETPIEDPENTEWMKWLMAGGRTPEEFAAIVRSYDNATTCGLVWTANFVAYRCRTCGISPCMSLCAACFRSGDHKGHDFNMFRSQAGGACDCGDTSVMKETGFCSLHGPRARVNQSPEPPELMCVAKAMMPRIILRLIQHLRDKSQPFVVCIQEADLYLTMLHDLSAMGAVMRKVMTSALTDPEIYKGLTDSSMETARSSAYHNYMTESKNMYQQALKSLPNPEPPDEYKDSPTLQEHLVHETFLEELMFWTVKYEFPLKIVCLLLNMLPDPDYKEALTRAFVLHYSRISMMLEASIDPETLSNKVVHVSVQLFSNESLAVRMVEQLNLLHVMVISLKRMMSNILIPSTLHDPNMNFHYVVDCGHNIMKEHRYWPLVSDLNNVLSHRPIAIKFMSDDNLLEMWFAFLSMFQGMNVNIRELAHHVEFEPNTYYAAFSAELESSAYPMWALLSHLSDSSTVELTRRILHSCQLALQDWLDAIDFSHPRTTNSLQVSFHLPLHRYLSVFMCQAIKHQGLSLKDVLPPMDVLMLSMMHPLRVQVAFYEILCGMWVRNGLQIKGQAMTYIQCNFCNSMVDADLYLLQICATQVPSEVFLTKVLENFHIKEWMSLAPHGIYHNSFLDREHDIPMLESCLTFLATLMTIRTNLGMDGASLSQLEIVTLLCMSDRTHSQLTEMMPERCGEGQSRDFEDVLSVVADYKAPNLEASGNMQQGMYVPKANVWEEMYDPIHVLLRAVHRRDFQGSIDRFTAYVTQTGRYKGQGPPWPPFRIPGPCSPAYEDPRKLLQSRVFHAMVFVILYKAVHRRNVSEHSLALTLYLLEMAVASAEPLNEHSQVCEASQSEPQERKDRDLRTWFKSDWLSSNLRTIISATEVEPEPVVVFDSSDSDIEPEASEMVGDISELATVNSATVGGTGSMLMLEAASVPAMSMDTSSGENYHLALSVPQGEVVMVSSVESLRQNQVAVPTIQRRLAVLAGTEIIPAGSTSNTHSGTSAGPSTSQHAMSSIPQHRAVLAGTEVVPASTASPSGASTTDVSLAAGYHYVPSATPLTVHGANHHRALVPHNSSEVLPSSSGPQKGFLKNRRKVMPSTSGGSEIIEINESIISLLLKLHSQLTGTQNSYRPDHPSNDDFLDCSVDSRIGDGPFFVSKLLMRISALDTMCRENLLQTQYQLWPQMQEECFSALSERDARGKEDRKQRIQVKQSKIIEEFACRRRQFMEKVMKTVAEDEDLIGVDSVEEQEMDTTLSERQLYDCVICNQTTHSTADNLMGLVVLVQSTSILGHKRRHKGPAVLPTSDAECDNMQRDDSLSSHFYRRMEELKHHFDTSPWMFSLNIGWEDGVHVQTCGHHLHLSCLNSYQASLLGQHRQQNLAVDRGEYWCPLCRQLANLVLPLPPEPEELSTLATSQPASLPSITIEFLDFIAENKEVSVPASVVDAVFTSLEDLSNRTYHKFKPRSTVFMSHTLFLFSNSIARTNLEVELVQRGNSLVTFESKSDFASASSSATSTVSDNAPVQLAPKRSCIVPLLHVLAVYGCVLKKQSGIQWQLWFTLQELTGIQSHPRTPSAVKLYEKAVPLLLREPTAILFNFLQITHIQYNKIYFSYIVKVLYNLLYFQVLMQLSCKMTEEARSHWRVCDSDEVKSHGNFMSLDGAMALIIGLLDQTHLYQLDDTNHRAHDTGASVVASVQASREWVEMEVQKLCLPFLRIATLLYHHLHSHALPYIANEGSEFASLVFSLGLVTEEKDFSDVTAADALNWPSNGRDICRSWCEQLVIFVNRSQISAHNILVDQHITWHRPRLLKLPYLYDEVFQYYHRKQCNQCHLVPHETSICLLCGTVVCLKQGCCKQSNVCEAVQHSLECGGGTGIFLVVTSSYIIVIRDKRACLWGSVYLDAFGEEDRELKRGKPLYLSQSRYWLLEQQWLSFHFDHTNKKWVWHRDGL